jgi:hypothetical protein
MSSSTHYTSSHEEDNPNLCIYPSLLNSSLRVVLVGVICAGQFGFLTTLLFLALLFTTLKSGAACCKYTSSSLSLLFLSSHSCCTGPFFHFSWRRLLSLRLAMMVFLFYLSVLLIFRLAASAQVSCSSSLLIDDYSKYFSNENLLGQLTSGITYLL